MELPPAHAAAPPADHTIDGTSGDDGPAARRTHSDTEAADSSHGAQQQQQFSTTIAVQSADPDSAPSSALVPPVSDEPGQSTNSPQPPLARSSSGSKRKQAKPQQWFLIDYDLASMQHLAPAPSGGMPAQPNDAPIADADSLQQQQLALELDPQQPSLSQQYLDDRVEFNPFANYQPPPRPSWRVRFETGLEDVQVSPAMREQWHGNCYPEARLPGYEPERLDHWAIPPADASAHLGAADEPPTPEAEVAAEIEYDDYDQLPVVHGYPEDEANPFAADPAWAPPAQPADMPEEEYNPFAAPPAYQQHPPGAEAAAADQTEHPGTPAEAPRQHSQAAHARSIDDDGGDDTLPFAPAAAAAASSAPQPQQQDAAAASGAARTEFVGADRERLAKNKLIVASIVSRVEKAGLASHLYSYGRQTQLSASERLAQFETDLTRNHKSDTKLYAIRRAFDFHRAYCEDNGFSPYPATTDTLLRAGQEYVTLKREEAILRREEALAAGRPPRSNDQGGATAGKPISEAWETLRAEYGLEYHIEQAVTNVLKAPPSDPHVRLLTPLQFVGDFEIGSRNESLTPFERAYCGASWLMAPSGGRVMDMRRVPRLRFIDVEILGETIQVCCLDASKSKARTHLDMKPLSMRAPMLPWVSTRPADLNPLITSLADSDEGGLFRQFEVEKGEHVITNAVRWKDSVASHDEVCKSQRALLVKMGRSPDAVRDTGGHDSRHILSEVGRCIALSKMRREALTYHRTTPVFGADEGDQEEYARAVRQARERMPRSGALSSQADRYSSRAGAKVVSDETRVICITAVQRATREWTSPSGRWPESPIEQMQHIASQHNRHMRGGGGPSA